MCKMVQFGHWALQLVLLCQLWQLGIACTGRFEHRSLGIYQEAKFISEEDIGEIVLFIIAVIVGEIGKKLDGGYVCPVYCGVDHKHIYRRCSETEEIYIQRYYGFHGSSVQQDREQSEGDLRLKGGIRIACSDSDSLVGIFKVHKRQVLTAKENP